MRTAVITGATSGIGYAVARDLAEQHYYVIGIGRTTASCDAAKAKIMHVRPEARIQYFAGDLMQLREANDIAEKISSYLSQNYNGRLDVLINNAGGVRNWYSTTEDGYEQQFALNHLAGFLLTYHMLPSLIKAGGRMILTGSNSHKFMKIRWKDIMFKKRYSCLYAYKQSKLCNLLFAKEFNARFADTRVKAYVVDPGLVNTDIGNKHTSGLVNCFWTVRKRFGVHPDLAAETYSFLVNQEPEPGGVYYYRCQERSYSKQADKLNDARRLFELSERLCGIRFEEGLRK